MTSETGSPHPELQELLDGRLAEEQRVEAQGHVEGCPSCRKQLEALAGVKRALANRRESEPEGLRESVAAAVRRDPAGTGGKRWRRPALAAAALAALVAAIALLRPAASSDLPGEAARGVADYRAGNLALARRTESAVELETYLRRERPQVQSRVFDFGMMGWRLIGGGPSNLGGRKATLFVYEGPGGSILICQMMESGWEDLPPPDDSRSERGITFRLYRRGGVSLVFWREPGAVCVLAGEESAEAVLALAVAKAGMT
jgi:anti-sigma factor RsiW